MGIGTPLEQVRAQTAISLTATSPTVDIGSTTETINGLTVANGVNGVINGAGGTLIYSGGPAFTLGSTTGGQTQNLNMSGLANFTFSGASQSFDVGGRFTGSGTNSGNTSAALTLAPNSVITASAFNVATLGNPASNAVRNIGAVNLQGSTVINADTVNIGTAGKTSGTLTLAAGGSLVLRGTDGTSPVANWNIGTVNSSSITSTIGNVNLSAGSLDAKVTDLLIGQAIAGNGQVGTATLTLGSGTLGATSIIVGSVAPGARNGENATLTVGSATVRTETLTVGDDASTAGLIATVNLDNGGALLAQTITGGAGNASRIFNWTNGTIGNEASGQNMTVSLASLALSGSGPHLFDIEGSGAVADVSSLLSGTGALTKQGEGTLVLTAANTYSGSTTIQDGTVRISGDGNLGATSGGLTLDGGTLEASASMMSARDVTLGSTGTFLTDTGTTLTLTGPLSGAGNMTKAGSGTLAVLGTGSYTGGTTIDAGILQLGNGGTSGSIVGDVVDNGVFAFDRSDSNTFGGVISGSGAVNQIGGGTTVLTGTNTYTGSTSVTNGGLIIDGNQSAATGLTTVLGGGTIGGMGTIGGSVVVNSGGALNPGDPGTTPGTLTVNGNLVLDSGSTLNYRFGEANVAGGPLNDLTNVGGNLTLAGTLNVTTTSGGSFGPGLYRVFNYAGMLTSNGLTLGTVPSPDYYLQTSVANQVNLVNATGLALNYWDGAAGPKDNGAVNGGNGVWQNGAGNDNWSDSTGRTNAPYSNGAFAMFEASPGTVTVDNSRGPVQAAGMQFASDGYHLTGDAIALTGGATSIVRVGDGTAAGAGYTATIDNVLSGSTQLTKTDLGTLVLAGANTYTGGTHVAGGTLSISSDGNLGAAGGALTLDGGTLETTADLTSARSVTLASAGTFQTDAGTSLTLTGPLDGSGSLTKSGSGSLVLAGTGAYTGGTTISAGTLQVGDGGTSGSITGNVTDNGTLVFDRSNTATFGDVISGTGMVNQAGSGTTVLTGANTYTGGTAISAGTLQLGSGGATGSITGNVIDNGTLAFDLSSATTFGGLISGSGGVNQTGSGVTVLTGANSYTGATKVAAGSLIVDGNQSAATGGTTVQAGGTLGGTGMIGGGVVVNSGGALNPGDPGMTPGTLTINGGLALDSGSTLNYRLGQSNVAGGALNDLTDVGGNLTLGGTLNVATTSGGAFAPGVYRIISYGGTLTNNGLAVGTVPSPDYLVQTAVANQINLVNTAGLTLNYWDGDGSPATKNDAAIEGGNGTWTAATAGANSINWTTADGTVSAPYAQRAFSIFEASPGTVTVDNSRGQVQTVGMQFAANGYHLTGAPIALTGGASGSIIRVGDGTSVGAGYTVTIDNVLDGTTGLIKTDLGTLVLNGSNTYTGGTDIQGGTVRISSDANLGAAGSGLTLDNGTLEATATTTSGRTVAIAGTGTFEPDAGATLTLAGPVSGAGNLVKTGAGTLALAGNATYTGGTTISAGTLQLGSGGTSGSVLGDVTDNGTLAFDRADVFTFTGAVTGTGAVVQRGTGVTVLDAVNTYTGATDVESGTLVVGDAAHPGATLGSGATTVAAGATLGGYGTAAGAVTNRGTIAVANALRVLAAQSSSAGGATGTLTIDGDLTNEGVVNLAAGAGQTGNVLKVGGNYMGSGGSVVLNTVLNEGGAATSTDLLTIGGNAGGSTALRVNGSAGGAQTRGDGIRLVQVGGTSAATAFGLAAPVQAGAWQYLLYRGGDSDANDWYLRSQLEAQAPDASSGSVAPAAVAPAYRPGVIGYAMTPSLNLDYGFSVLGTLHERVGDMAAIEGSQPGHGDGVWARTGGQHVDINGNERFSSEGNTFFAQFGKDWTLARPDTGGSTHAGVTLTMGTSSANFADSARSLNATLSTTTGTLTSEAQSIGGYWTRYFADHAYVDAVAQLTHYHDKYSDVYGGRATQNGIGAAGALEVGKPWLLGSTSIAIEPQAQLQYQYLHLNDFSDGVSSVSGNTSNALRGRLGFRLFRANLENDTKTGAATPYLTVDVLHDFFTPGTTGVGGTAFGMAPAKTWYELGAGVTASLGKASVLYVAISYARNVGGEYRRTLFGQGGYRYSW